MGRVAILLALAFLCGCGSSRQTTAAVQSPGSPEPIAPPAALQFPDDFAALPPRQGSLTEEDVTRDGFEFDATLPHNAVSGNSFVEFAPDPAQPGLNAFAYCIYSFDLTDFDLLPVVQATWNVASDETYIGVSDWEGGRWKWFAVNPVDRLNLGSMVRHIRDDGTFLLAIVCGGDTLAGLNSLRIGGEDPRAVITASPPGGFAPLNVELHGFFSQDDQLINKYEWDLDGDGSFEFVSGEGNVPEPLNFCQPGEYLIRLRVTDRDSVQDSTELLIKVSTGWSHTLGGSSFDTLKSVASDGLAAIYACGTTHSFGAGSSDLWLLRFDFDGNLIWARSWGTAGFEDGLDLDIDSNGNIVTLANGGPTSSEAYILRWSPEGELLISLRVFDPNQLFPTALDLFNDRAIVCGERFDLSDQVKGRLCLFDLNLDTKAIAIRQWKFDVGSSFQVADVAASPGIFPGFERYYCVGTSDQAAFILETDGGCNDIIAQKLSGPISSSASSISLGSSVFADPYVAGSIHDESPSSVFVTQWDLEAPISSSFLINSTSASTFALLRSPGGNHFVGGGIHPFFGWLHSFDEAGTISDTRLYGGEAHNFQCYGMALVGSAGIALVGIGDNGPGLEMQHAVSEPVALQLAWETISITDSMLGAPEVSDFEALVTTSDGVQLDQDVAPGSDGQIIFDSLS